MATFNEDSLASDEILASQDVKANERLICPLCFNLFRSPRQLPCSHSFCEFCLQSHILKTVSKSLWNAKFDCPVCECKVYLPEENSDKTSASLFPVSTFILFMLFKDKRDGERTCDACNSEKVSSEADWYCFDCNEAMCTSCLKFHSKHKILKDHNVISIDEFINKPASVTKYGAEFQCDVHVRGKRRAKYQRCLVCVGDGDTDYFSKTKDDLTKIINRIKTCEDDVTKLIESNRTNSSYLKSQAQEIMDQVSDLRKKLNDTFDELEKKVQQHAQKLCQKELVRIQKTDKICQSLKAAIKNTSVIFDAVDKYGSHEQKYTLAEKIKHHSSHLKDKIDQTRIQNEAVTLNLEINPILKLMLAIPTRYILGLKVRRNDCEVIVADEQKPLKVYNVKSVDALKIEVSKKLSNAVYISESSIIFTESNHCLKFDLSTKLSTVYSMPDDCYDASSICSIGDNQVAVSFPRLKTVYLFSVCDGNLRIQDHLKTRQRCSSIITVSREQIIVSGQCEDNQCFYWSLVTLDGKEKSYQEFDGYGSIHTHMALNSHKTLLYICIRGGNSLYCFGIDGAVYYRKRLEGVVSAAGVALDKDDNVYVVGKRSNNIFQLSQDGKVLKVLKDGIPTSPSGICFNPSGDKFICLSKLIYKSERKSLWDKYLEVFALSQRKLTNTVYLFELI